MEAVKLKEVASYKGLAFWRFALPVVVAIALPSCGGGGGGGSSGSGGLSVSPTSLNFTGTLSDTTEPAVQTINITVDGSAYLSTEYSGIAYEAAPLQIDGNSATATVRVPAPSMTGAGVHLGRVTVNAYEYGFGGSHIAGSPKEIAVTYTIPGIVTSDTPVFNQTSGGPLPAAQTVTVSDAMGNSFGWTTTVEYVPILGLPDFTNWLQVTPASGGSLPANVTFTVISQGQPGIEYSAYVNITSVADPSVKARVPVLYRAK